MISRINWYIKNPTVQLRSDYYLQPFDTHVWVILLATTLFGISLTLLSQCFLRKKKRCLIDDLFLGFETFCNQCGNEHLDSVYLRFKCISLRLASIVSISLYCATITSYFAVETYEPPFTNFEEFIHNGEYRLLLNRTSDLILLGQVK